MKNSRHQHGMSLLEVMVALIISLFLLGGIMQVLLASKVSYRFSNAVTRIQENGRFALDTIGRDFRMLGNFGCTIYDPDNTDTIVNNMNQSAASYDQQTWYQYLSEGMLEGFDNVAFANNSDKIILRGSQPGQVHLAAAMASPSDPISIKGDEVFNREDFVLIGDCESADIFMVTNTTDASRLVSHDLIGAGHGSDLGNLNRVSCVAGKHCLSRAYGADATMLKLQTVMYYVATEASWAGELPALMRRVDQRIEYLVHNVEQMHVLYGLDTDSDNYANQYVISSDVPDMNDVMSVRISLLMVSEDDFILEAPQTYTYNGATTTATDRRLRRVFSTTIALRNRAGTE